MFYQLSEILDRSSRGIGPHNVDQLIEEIQKNPGIKAIKLYRNNIDTMALEKLIPVLISLLKIENLDLSFNQLIDEDIKILAPLIETQKLKSLNLSMNTGITNQSCAIIKVWQEQYNLEVNTNHTSIDTTISVPIVLIDALQQSTSSFPYAK